MEMEQWPVCLVRRLLGTPALYGRQMDPGPLGKSPSWLAMGTRSLEQAASPPLNEITQHSGTEREILIFTGMTRISIPRFHAITVTFIITLSACSGEKKDTGHYRLSQQISKDSAEKIKNNIRAISNDVLTAFQYTGANKITINYRLLSPASSNKKDKYPLVLVLHGSGAVGTDNTTQLSVLVKLWAQPYIRERYFAYVLAPQFPQRSSNYSPDPDKKVLVSTPDPCLTTALQLIDSLKKTLPIDEKKIYVIGFSMGGSGTINSLELRPDLFAAAVAISGIPAFNHTNTLAKVPIWLIHGNADTENPMGSDSLLYEQLHARHDPHIKFWEIDHLGHDIYPDLYTGDKIPRWLFSH
jgi:predicted peptidase